jgi:hypothetical protein
MALRRILSVSAIVLSSALAVGCASPTEDDGASNAAALETLDTASCATPTTSEAPLTDSSGNPINGTGKTTLSGCIVGHTGETGTALLGRAGTLVSNPSVFAQLEDQPGHKLLSAFNAAGAATGTLATGLTQDFDVTLNEQYSPTTRLRIVRTATATGLTVKLTNTTALVAHSIFSVTVVNPGDLSLTMTLTAAANGATVAGSSQVVMQQGQDHAADVSGLIVPVFNLLSKQLDQ